MTKNAVSAAMCERVMRQLKEIETRYGVRVLYACESGSRFVCSSAGVVSAG